MPKEEPIRVEATVREALPNASSAFNGQWHIVLLSFANAHALH